MYFISSQESPNTAQIEREHSEAEQRRQKLLIDRQQVFHYFVFVAGQWMQFCVNLSDELGVNH